MTSNPASVDRILRRFGVVLLAALLVAAGPHPASAQSALGESAKELIGAWEFSTADRQTACTVTFKADRAGKGFRVEFEDKCAAVYPAVKDIASWTFPDNDLLNLLDGSGKSLIEFSEVESGIFEAPVPGYGVLFLQHPDAAGSPAAAPEQLAGEWALMRGGKALCGLTLTLTPADDEYALTVKPGCDAAIARLNFGRWRIDRDELMLRPERGNPWRFEEDENKAWSRVPEAPNPYTLVKH
jgi:hypothetical protein